MSSDSKEQKEKKQYKAAFQKRDISWIRFNERVLEEGETPNNPLLERCSFVSIVTSNMDEFFQVRYHSAYEKRGSEKGSALYDEINMKLRAQCDRQYKLYDRLMEELQREGIAVYPAFPKNEAVANREKAIFTQDILPYLKVESFADNRLRQKQLYLCVKLMRKKNQPFRLIPLPTAIPRVYDLEDAGGQSCLISLENIIRNHLHSIFPKEMIEYSVVFRILRDQDMLLEDDSPEGICAAIRKMLAQRENGKVMRLETEKSISAELLALLMRSYHLEPERIYMAPGPLDLGKLMRGVYNLVKRPELKYDLCRPLLDEELMGDDLFERIEEKDRLLYHPYYSFDPIVHFVQLAAMDPKVTAISQTLYRVSANSPIASALIKAAENGKKVFVMMEVRARFDEENNLFWGEKLERAGCRVLYSVPGLKVHSKITLVERETQDGTRCYLHLGTGNYHDGTAKAYTDFGLLTADSQLCEDALCFFDNLKNRHEGVCTELAPAPYEMYPRLEELIERERENAKDGKPSHILAKMNSINDPVILTKLIDAARDGVHVNLLVRGICTVLPKVDGITDHLRVRSIVGRNLEHARAFIFENGGDHEVYLASADWMERNLYKRVELLFPVKDEECRKAVENVLWLQWNDTEKCRHGKKDGSYVLKPGGRIRIDAQDILIHDPAAVFAGTHPVFDSIPALFQRKSDFLKSHEERELPYLI